ncbi:MAG: DUF2892 domain-containing protein [Bacteroidota bacterium]
MKANMGLIDKIARVSVAAIVIALYFLNQISGLAAIVLLIFSGVFILTSIIGFCPLYLPLKINTKAKK